MIANDFSSAVGMCRGDVPWGCAVGMCRDGAHDGQPLGGHGDPVIAEEDGGIWLRACAQAPVLSLPILLALLIAPFVLTSIILAVLKEQKYLDELESETEDKVEK
ncbi:hypothetical protein N9F44_00365 [Akkermansiaceae bacterium]|nr:hypothetical protein [Akkermansiaceae bacterium]MDA8975441.1 hypothetical protein [Akkermansiaceae bacterium]